MTYKYFNGHLLSDYEALGSGKSGYLDTATKLGKDIESINNNYSNLSLEVLASFKGQTQASITESFNSINESLNGITEGITVLSELITSVLEYYALLEQIKQNDEKYYGLKYAASQYGNDAQKYLSILRSMNEFTPTYEKMDINQKYSQALAKKDDCLDDSKKVESQLIDLVAKANNLRNEIITKDNGYVFKMVPKASIDNSSNDIWSNIISGTSNFMNWYSIPNSPALTSIFGTTMVNSENSLVGAEGATNISGIGQTSLTDNSTYGKVELKGIDVSKWQGEIDWDKVKASGKVDYAIIRAYSGKTGVDSKFIRNAEECTRLGIPIGSYLYTYAKTEKEAKKEVEGLLETIKPYKIDYPVVVDMEQYVKDTSINDDLVNVCKVQCNAIKEAGYTPCIYASKWWLEKNKNTDTIKNNDTWVAHYNEETDYSGDYTMWQHTSKGKIPGITNNVDLNIAYKDYTKEEA